MDHSIVDIMETIGQISDGRLKFPTIFKVNVGLRESNPAAYIPKLISIGPYHNKNPKLHLMEKYKLMYLQRFLNRKKRIDVESYMRELEKLKDRARLCYDDIENLDKCIVDKFLEIMLLDGCFLVEFIRERFVIRQKGGQYRPIIDNAWMINQVCRDMVVLENQLPFFVLTTLYDMTKRLNEESFLYMVRHTLLEVSPKATYIPKSEIDRLNAKQLDHLLHLVHMISCPSEIISGKHTEPSKKKGFCNINICLGEIWQRMKRSKETPDNLNSWECSHIPSATRLLEARVSFKKIGSVKEDHTDTTTLLDIKFENGLMEIPCFAVQDSTETFLRNLIAFEQHSSNTIRSFSDYADIMNRLINSHKDVKLLRESGIIHNYLGDDKGVVNIFRRLSDGLKTRDNFYDKERIKIVQHCQKSWNKMMANFRYVYYRRRLLGASSVLATVMLILTIIQTVLAFKGCATC